jgi:hypothetical protein
MSSTGAASRAAVPGAPTRPGAPVNNARAEASRRNGARSRGPTTAEGKARAAQNALRHGMRAQKFVVLPDEDAGEFAALEAAMIAELAPVGALQAVLARRVAVAAWRLARADRMETELFEERRWDNRGVGVALIRDGNGTRSFETLMRYRSAAMAEFMRALRTLKALQAGQAAMTTQLRAVEATSASVPMFEQTSARTGAAEACRAPNQPDAAPRPNQPEPAHRPRRPETRRRPLGPSHEPNTAVSAASLHEAAAPWQPNEPELRETVREAGARRTPAGPGSHRTANEPEAVGISARATP